MGRGRRKYKGPRLFIFRGEHLTVAPAPIERLIIGRHRRCHLRIPNPDVNLKHAVIERVGTTERFRLLDFGTTIPTLVNGTNIDGAHALEFGDQIDIADVFIYYERVRKDAPEEHRIAFDNLLEMEKSSKGKLLKAKADEDDEGDEGDEGEEGEETVEAEAQGDMAESGPSIKGRGRRRKRTGLKSTARRRRNARR